MNNEFVMPRIRLEQNVKEFVAAIYSEITEKATESDDLNEIERYNKVFEVMSKDNNIEYLNACALIYLAIEKYPKLLSMVDYSELGMLIERGHQSVGFRSITYKKIEPIVDSIHILLLLEER